MQTLLTKTSGKIDLAYQHSLCEINYARLVKLIPCYHEQDHFQLTVSYGNHKTANRSTLSITVLQRSPYTTRISMKLESVWGQWVKQPNLEVQLYHDAMMAEVTMAQKVRRLPIGVEPLHSGICQPNEKILLNRFLADLLDFCVQGGHVADSVFCPS